MTENDIAGRVAGTNGSAIERPNKGGQGTLEKIINGCRAESASSQEMLYKKFYGYALAVAMTYCYTKEDAVEVVNDSFIKVFANIDTFIPTRPFKPWLRQIVVHTSIDKVRAHKKFQNHVDTDGLQQSSPTDIEAELSAGQIYTLLNELPDMLRMVFNMYEIEGYSHREISQKLDIAESSSRTYLTRAKERLRQLYEIHFTG